MAEIIRINHRNRVHEDELTFVASRSGGPGGQHRDKAETRVQLRFSIPHSRGLSQTSKERLLRVLAPRLTQDGEIVLASERTRSQHQNREDCVQRLEELLREALTPPKPRVRTRPPVQVDKRRLESKRRRGEKKRMRRRPSRTDLE